MSWAEKINLLDQEIERLRHESPSKNHSKDIIKSLFFGIDPESLVQNLSALDYGCDEKSGVVVSLTSYPQRVHAGVTLATLVSLLRSQVKPHAIVLYLSKDEFPEQVIKGPYAKAYQIVQDKGVTVRYVDGNLMSHKKYFYVAQDYPDHAHMTVDDDIYYPKFLLKELQEGSKKHPGSIVCCKAYQMVDFLLCKGTKTHCLFHDMSQSKEVNHFQKPSMFFVFPGGTGALYPIGFLHKARDLIAQHGLHSKYALDDNVLKVAQIFLGVAVYKIPFTHRMILLSIHGMFCDYEQYFASGVMKLDLLNHAIFSHRFPEYGHRNAYEAMDVAPHPDVIQAMERLQCTP